MGEKFHIGLVSKVGLIGEIVLMLSTHVGTNSTTTGISNFAHGGEGNFNANNSIVSIARIWKSSTVLQSNYEEAWL